MKSPRPNGYFADNMFESESEVVREIVLLFPHEKIHSPSPWFEYRKISTFNTIQNMDLLYNRKNVESLNLNIMKRQH